MVPRESLNIKPENSRLLGKDESGSLTFLNMANGAKPLENPPFKTPLPENFRTNPNTAHLVAWTLRDAAKDFDWTKAEDSRIPLRSAHVDIFRRDISLYLKALDHNYHNFEHSIYNVAPSMKELMEKARIPTEDGFRPFSESEIALGEIAGLLHDLFHSGSTYRQLALYLKLGEQNQYRLTATGDEILVEQEDTAIRGLPLTYGAMFSNEEYACITGDRIVGGLISIVQRLELQGMILATSFGQRNSALFPKDVPEEVLYRPYFPLTWQEKLLAFADVSNFRGEINDWFEENFNVYKEKSPEQIPATYQDFLEERRKFLEFYVRDKLNDVRPLFEHDPDYLERIEGKLDRLLDEIEKLKSCSSNFSDSIEAGFKRLRAAFGLA